MGQFLTLQKFLYSTSFTVFPLHLVFSSPQEWVNDRGVTKWVGKIRFRKFQWSTLIYLKQKKTKNPSLSNNIANEIIPKGGKMVVSDKSYRHFLCDWQNCSEFHERQSERDNVSLPNSQHQDGWKYFACWLCTCNGQGVGSPEERYCNPIVTQLKINIFARQLFWHIAMSHRLRITNQKITEFNSESFFLWEWHSCHTCNSFYQLRKFPSFINSSDTPKLNLIYKQQSAAQSSKF